MTSSSPSDHAPRGRVINPTIVIGLDAAGGAIADAVRREGEAAGTDGVHDLVRFLSARSDEAGFEALAAAFREALEGLLSLDRVAAVRADQGLWSAPVDVFVVARLGPGHTPPDALGAVLAALDPAARAHARRLVTPDGRPRLFVSPLLLLPEMPAASVDPEWRASSVQAAVIDALAGLRRRLQDPGTGARLGRVYLTEPGTRTFLLDDDARAFMVRAFLAFLLYGSLRRDAQGYQRAYEPTSDRAPFGAFVVARAELPAGVYRPYLRARTALAGLEAFRAPRDALLDAERGAAPDTTAWVDALIRRAEERTDPAIDALVDDQLAALTPPPAPMRLLEGPRAFRARHGAPWIEANSAAIAEIAARASEDDGRVAELLSRVDLEGAQDVRAAEAAIAERLDDACLDRDAPGHHGDGLRLVDAVTRELDQRRDTLAAVANGPLPPLDGVTELEAEHAALARAAAAKPEPRRFLAVGAGALLLLWVVGCAALPLLGLLFEDPLARADRPLWRAVLMDDPAYRVVAAVLVFGFGGLWLWRRLAKATREVNRYLAGESLLGAALDRVRRSLAVQFTGRRDASLAHGACRLLTRHLDQLDRERRALVRADDALSAQIEALRQRLRGLGVTADPQRSPPQVRDTVLARPLVDADALVGLGSRVRDAVLGDDPIRAVKRALDPYAHRHAVVPFADLGPLDAKVDARAAQTDVAGVLADATLGDQAARRLAAFFRETLSLSDLGGGRAVGARLQLPLDTVSVEAEDGDRVGGLDAPRILAHRDVISALLARPELADDPELRRALEAAKPFHDPERVYLMQVVWGLPPAAIGWLADAWRQSPGADVIPMARRPDPGSAEGTS